MRSSNFKKGLGGGGSSATSVTTGNGVNVTEVSGSLIVSLDPVISNSPLWNAKEIQGVEVNDSAIAEGKALVYHGGKLVYDSVSSAITTTGLTWQNVSGDSVLAPNGGYFGIAAQPIFLSLPAIAPVGAEIILA